MHRLIRLGRAPLLPAIGSLCVLVAVGCGGQAVESVGGAQGTGGADGGTGGGTGGRASTGGMNAVGGTSPGTGGSAAECQTNDDCRQLAGLCETFECEGGACVEKYAADDGDPCTDDFCSDMGISHISIADDGDACTLDLCDANGDVSHLPLEDDGDPCTDDFCDSAIGATHVPTNVDDGDACTVDSCDSVLGVRHQDIDIDDNNACTVDQCNSVSGAQHAPLVCPPNACGDSVCDPAVGCVTPPGSSCCTNLAPSATPTMSAGGPAGAGSYGPGQLNDGQTQANSCAKYAWIYNSNTPSQSTSDVPYFQYTWPSPVTIESMYIDTLNAMGEACKDSTGRNFKGAKVQYWTGSTWATSTTIDNRTGDFKLTLPNPVTTTAIRLYDVTSGNLNGNTLVYEWYVYPIAGCSP